MTILNKRIANCLLAALCAAAILPLRAAGQALPPVEGRRANTAYAPAFAGQTRAPGIETQTPYETELVAEGLRNPWGLAALPDGRILITQKSGSLRIVSPDGQISGAPIGPGETAREGMEQPVYYWDPVIAPSGMAFYHAAAMPEWQGNLFIGALAGQHISRLVLEDGRVLYEERLLSQESQRFRDILAHPDGSLYAITDGGRLYRVGPVR